MLQASAIHTNSKPVLLGKASRMATKYEFVESLMRYRVVEQDLDIRLIQQRTVLNKEKKHEAKAESATL